MKNILIAFLLTFSFSATAQKLTIEKGTESITLDSKEEITVEVTKVLDGEKIVGRFYCGKQ